MGAAFVFDSPAVGVRDRMAEFVISAFWDTVLRAKQLGLPK